MKLLKPEVTYIEEVRVTAFNSKDGGIHIEASQACNVFKPVGALASIPWTPIPKVRELAITKDSQNRLRLTCRCPAFVLMWLPCR